MGDQKSRKKTMMMKRDNNVLFFGNFIDADLKFADMQDYLNDIDKFIDRKKRYKAKKISDNIFKDILPKMFAESFSSILFDSVLISTWVFMEAELKGYCNAMREAMGINLTYSDLKGSAIERFRIYTAKVLKLDLRLGDNNWEDLKAINEIRNSLVHRDGTVGNKRLVNNFIKRNKLHGLLSKDKISLEKGNLIIIIMLCRLFVERIYVIALEKFPGHYGPKS
jgi:hypothetical protein